MALPIQKLSRTLLCLNRSILSTKFVRTIALFPTASKKRMTNAPNFLRVIGNQKWRPASLVMADRRLLSAVTADEVRKRVDSISTKFTDAVELINDAKSSMGTIYFTDDMKDAEELVAEVMTDYQTLLASLTDKQRTDVQRTIGLKMEELKAQITILKDSIKE